MKFIRTIIVIIIYLFFPVIFSMENKAKSKYINKLIKRVPAEVTTLISQFLIQGDFGKSIKDFINLSLVSKKFYCDTINTYTIQYLVKYYIKHYGYNLLMQKAENNSELLKFLIKAHVPLKYLKDESGHSIIFSIIKKENWESILNKLIKEEYKITDKINMLPEGVTLFALVLQARNLEMLKLLLKLDTNINQYFIIRKEIANFSLNSPLMEFKSYCPLTLAIENNDIESIEFLLKNGADPNGLLKLFSETLNYDHNITVVSYSALKLAIYKGCFEIIEILLKYKADPNYQDEDGFSILECAIKFHDFYGKDIIKLVKLLLEYGADPNLKNKKDGYTPFSRFIYYITPLSLINKTFRSLNFKLFGQNSGKISTYLSVISLLLDYDADINTQSKNGLTPIMISLLSDQNDIFEKLLEYRPDLNKQDINGITATMIAITYCKSDTVKKLVNYGVNLDIQDTDGETALMYAVKIAKIKIVRLIIQAGANINITSNSNLTALDLAIQEKNKANSSNRKKKLKKIITVLIKQNKNCTVNCAV